MVSIPKGSRAGANTNRLHADSELGLSQLEGRVDGIDASVPYTPADPAQWASPPPSTIAEALDRLAAANPGA